MQTVVKKLAIVACVSGLFASSAFCAVAEPEASLGLLHGYETTVHPPVEVLVVLPHEAVGGTLNSLNGKKFTTQSGTLLLILSPVEQVYFKNGKLARYQFMSMKGQKQRVTPSIKSQFALSVGAKAFMQYIDTELFGHWFGAPEKGLYPITVQKIDSKPFTMTYEAKTKTYLFTLGECE